MFRFAYPDYLYLLLLIPLLLVGFLVVFKKSSQQLKAFASEEMLKIISPRKSNKKIFMKFLFVLLAIALIIGGIANPQVGTKMETIKQVGIDIFILLDVSKSMAAQDIQPSRLQKAKFEISKLIQNLKGDRIGLIVFSGDAYIQFPLTSDYSAANLFLNSVDHNSVPQPGTAIESAIRLASNSFQENVKTKKAIVLITDGEDHEGNIMSAVEEAKEKGIKIFCIGVGSKNGAPIPIMEKNSIIGYKKDELGNVIISKLDEATLRQIAKEGDGKFYRSTNSDDELEKVFYDLAKIEKNMFGETKVADYEDRFYYLLIPAFFILLVEIFISPAKSKIIEQLKPEEFEGK